MPKKGYKSITVPEDLYQKLVEISGRYGTTPQGIIKMMVFDGPFYQKGPAEPEVLGSNPSGPAIKPSFLEEKKLYQEKSFLNKREIGTVPAEPNGTVPDREDFIRFCKVDLQQQQRTASAYYNLVRRFLQSHEFTVEEIRAFLSEIEKPNTYNNWLKAFIAYAKYLGASLPFRLRRPPETVRPLRTKKELQEFFYALETDAERTLFIGYAVTGLRRRELLNLKVCQVNFELRAVFPNHGSVTKRSYITFYNEELEELLDVWLRLRSKRSDRLFPMRSSEQSSIFLTAYRKTGLRITPQDLRLWFANEMARLGVPDRFIDAFQGRIPRSVLARHYTDYSLENLKAIYDRAGLKVLS